MAKKIKDKVQILEEENFKLKKIIKDKDAIIKQLKKEKKQLNDKSVETDDWLIDVTNGVPLSEVLSYVNNGGKLKIKQDRCPKCKDSTVEKLIFSKFYLVTCGKCGYRNKVDESKKTEKN